MNTLLDVLDNQRVRKRRYYGIYNSSGAGRAAAPVERVKADSQSGASSRSIARKGNSRQKPAFRPEGIVRLAEQNTRFIEKLIQNPVKAYKEKRVDRPGSYVPSRPRSPSGKADHDQESWFSSYLMPAISVAGVLLVVAGIFFIVASQGGSFAWTGREVVSSERDDGSRYNLALYAGVYAGENQAVTAGEDIPLDLTETFEWHNYKVKKGDSVSKIAAAFSVSMDAIIASNGITNARILREGDTLKIPNMDGIPYAVKNGDSLSGISKSMGVPLEAILDANDIQSDTINAGTILFIPGARMKKEDLKLALGELFVYPLKGARLSSPFGWRDDPISGVRRHHAAVDLVAPLGTPIKAAMDGKVMALGYNATYGNYIVLSHAGSFQTMYAHLNTTAVKRGDQVSQGAQIGTVGNTGYSTGPHLHFAVFKNNRAVNPLDYLNPQR